MFKNQRKEPVEKSLLNTYWWKECVTIRILTKCKKGMFWKYQFSSIKMNEMSIILLTDYILDASQIKRREFSFMMKMKEKFTSALCQTSTREYNLVLRDSILSEIKT